MAEGNAPTESAPQTTGNEAPPVFDKQGQLNHLNKMKEEAAGTDMWGREDERQRERLEKESQHGQFDPNSTPTPKKSPTMQGIDTSGAAEQAFDSISGIRKNLPANESSPQVKSQEGWRAKLSNLIGGRRTH